MRNDVYRDGKLFHRGEVNYFRFDQQGNQLIQQQTYQLLPNDSFVTTCTYNNKDKKGIWGHGSAEEMCISFFMYYPKQTLWGFIPWNCVLENPWEVCVPEYSNKTVKKVNRTFGESLETVGGTCSGFCGEECGRNEGKSSGATIFTTLATVFSAASLLVVFSP